jgi:uncharacterized protein YdaL
VDVRLLSRRTLLSGLAVGTAGFVTTGLAACGEDASDAGGQGADGQGLDPAGSARTLILYDTSGEFGHLGELYAIQAANLVSHFGDWHARPVVNYDEGQHAGYDAMVYIGSTFGEPLPKAFLDDVADGAASVIWLRDNIDQLTALHKDLPARLGFTTGGIDSAGVAEIRYRGTALTRDAANVAGLVGIAVRDPAKAVTVAEALRADGATVPWAVRSGVFTYLSELPFVYSGPTDRYLVFADLLFDVLAPDTAVRHRALVRLEDVGPQSDPVQLREVADYLHSRAVPFSVALYAQHRDATGSHATTPTVSTLAQRPAVVAALAHMVARGGTLIMHGFTHGYAAAPNPYGVSGGDFEFYRAHIDHDDKVVLDGPVPEDSAAWARGRVASARREWKAAGLTPSQIWEFPHYAASATDYRTISAEFAARYENPMYFNGVLGGGPVDHSRWVSQYFPYPVRDVYGSAVIPETLGNFAPTAANQHGVRSTADIVAAARRQLVVRDGVASFFYHPYLGSAALKEIVPGIQALGYTFVPAESMFPAIK